MNKTFLSKIQDFFFNKISTKIIALIVTLGIWMVFSNIEDPEQTKSYTVPVKVTNVELLETHDQYYETTGEENVTFRVTAARSTLEKLNNGDFVATADLKYLEDGRIPINITANRFANSISIISATQYYYVEIGDIVTKTFPIEVQIKGEPTSPYVVSEVMVDPAETTITGPLKIVDNIKESYNELAHKTSWPTPKELTSSSVVVLIASLILALIVWLMDFAFENLMTLIYGLF